MNEVLQHALAVSLEVVNVIKMRFHPFTSHARVHRPKQIATCWYRSTALGKERSVAKRGKNFSTDDPPDVIARSIVALLIEKRNGF
jgi:hypothetical protein